MNPDVRIQPDGETLSREVARAVFHRVREILNAADHFSFALAGGETPRRLYQTLATEYRDRIAWPRLHVFWGDERYVPHDDPRSNVRLAREALLDHVPIPGDNVHPMPTGLPAPEEAAAAYEQTLRRWFPGPWPRFDLVLLGMGSDGHTASLFPGAAAFAERTRWAVAASAPVEPRLRLTLTLPVFNHAALVFFLVAGSEKAAVLGRVLAGPSEAYPAAAVRPDEGGLVWWVDEAAAKSIQRREAR